MQTTTFLPKSAPAIRHRRHLALSSNRQMWSAAKLGRH